MGFLGLFGSNVTNPALSSAIEKYCSDPSDDNLVDVWQKFLKAKLLLSTTPDGAKAFGKIKQIREAMGLPFNTVSNESGDNLLSVWFESEAFKTVVPETAHAVNVTGEQALQLASSKGLLGLALNPKSTPCMDLKVWQHQIFIERVSDAVKLQALASKLIRSGNMVDAEGVLKGAIFAAQRSPGAQHPLSAELNVEMARVQKALGKGTEAEWSFRRALGIYENCGSQDLDVANTAESLAQLLYEQNKIEAAAPLLQRALNIYESVPGGKPENIGRILCQLGDIKCGEGKVEDGEHYYKRASVTLEERKHPDLLGVLNKMGALCENTGRTKEALAFYNRVMSVFESLKRARDGDLGRAAYRAAIIYHAEKNIPEARLHLEKALTCFHRDGTTEEIDAVNTLLKTVKEQGAAEAEAKAKSEAEEKEKPKPAFSRGPAKRPSELPLLDMSAVKSNPRATLVGGKKAEDVEEKPTDPEAQALEQMRAFLDSVNKDGGKSETPGESKAPSATPPSSPGPSKQPDAIEEAIEEKAIEDVVKSAIDKHDAAVKAESQQGVAEPIAQSTQASRQDEDDEHLGVEELFAVSSQSIKPPPKTPSEAPPSPPAPPAKPGTGASANDTKSAQESNNDRFDKPIAERVLEKTEQPSAPAASSESDKKSLFNQNVSGDISMVFNKNMMGGEVQKSDRFDKPISERTPEKQQEEDDLEDSLNKAFGALMSRPDQAARYDTPIQDRKTEEASRFDTPISERKTEDASRFDTPISERKKEDASRFDTPISERKTEDASRFDTPISERKKEDASRFDIPISERKKEDASRFDTPISERKTEDASRFDTPISERKLDPSRFDTPIQERNQSAPAAKEDGGIFNDLDNSLNDAFAGLLADPSKEASDRFEKPIAERLKDSDRFDQSIQSRTAEFLEVTGERPAAKAEAEAAPSPTPKAETPAEPIDLSKAKTPDELLALIEKKLEQEPNDSELWLRKGTVLAQLQKLDEAIKVFDKVCTMTPKDPKAWYCKGSSLHLKNRFEDALYCFNHVLNLDTDNVKAMLRKAECLVKLSRADQSMVVYDRILVLQPKFVAGWLSKGRALLQQRKLEEALTCYEEALSIEPNNEEANKAKNLITSKIQPSATS